VNFGGGWQLQWKLPYVGFQVCSLKKAPDKERLPSLTLTLSKHRLGRKKNNQKKIQNKKKIPPTITCQHKTPLSKPTLKTQKALFPPNFTLKTSPLPSVTTRHLHHAPTPFTSSTSGQNQGLKRFKNQV